MVTCKQFTLLSYARKALERSAIIKYRKNPPLANVLYPVFVKKGIFPLPYRFFPSVHIINFDVLTEYFSILINPV